MVDNTNAKRVWEQLFVNDCHVTYPFGTHQGREGLGKWALSAESVFKRMQVGKPCKWWHVLCADVESASFLEFNDCD